MEGISYEKTARSALSTVCLATILTACAPAKPEPIIVQTPSAITVAEITQTSTPEKQEVQKTPQEIFTNYLDTKIQLSEEYTHIVELLNNPDTQQADYSAAIEKWKGNTPIYHYLTSLDSKVRFLKEILAKDNLESHPYVTVNYGPDVDGDGVVEVQNIDGKTINEAGEEVDETSFVCQNFAQEMTRRYGITIEGINTSPSKFKMPLFTVETSEGFDGKERWGREHAINGVLVGDDPNNKSHWIFFEPQNDEILSQQVPGISKELIQYGANGSQGSILKIGIPYIDHRSTSFTLSLATFSKSSKTDGIEFVAPETAEVMKSIASWVTMKNLTSSGNSEFSPKAISEARNTAIDSGYISAEIFDGAMKEAVIPISNRR